MISSLLLLKIPNFLERSPSKTSNFPLFYYLNSNNIIKFYFSVAKSKKNPKKYFYSILKKKKISRSQKNLIIKFPLKKC